MVKNTKFGVVVGHRGFFNSALAIDGRKKILNKLNKLGYEITILPEHETPLGSVETIEDAKKYAKLFKEKSGEIDGIIVSLPNFGDELGILNTIKLSNLNVPILIQASDDYIDKVDLKNRRDAFCGKLSVCNNFYQNKIPFTDTLEHTIDIDSEVFSKDIFFFEKVCRVVNRIKKARIGMIGTRPAAFQTMRFSEKILQDSGITVIPVDLSEIIFRALNLKDKDDFVQEQKKSLLEYGNIPKEITQNSILKQSKLSAAVNEWVEENSIDALAVQCWESIQNNYGCAACATMSMLGERLIPSACEADVAGAVSMYALTLASGKASALTDWNNNYGDDRSKCVVTHCSSYPKSFVGRKIEISNLDVLGESLGAENCFGAIKGKVAKGSMTFFRMDTDDLNGRIRAYLGEGEFTDDPFDMAGGVAVCQINNLRNLMKYICKNGFEHHVGMVRSNCAEVIEHSMTNYFDWDIYRHS